MTFSQLTGCKNEVVELPASSNISALIEKLVLKYGRKFRKAIEKDIDNRSVLYMINDIIGAPETELHDNDEVLISYPVGGG
jgi:molybdopterin converting factor small subunit